MSKRKNPSNSDNVNAEFCEFLSELAEYEKNVSRNIHKYNAYRKAASVLACHNKRIQSGEEAKKLNGIGEKISKKIDEFLQTGKLRKLENIHKDEKAQAISLLTRVSGIGPVKASELVNSGIMTIKDLEINKNKLTHQSSSTHWFKNLEDQYIARFLLFQFYRYFEDFEKMIPRSEIREVETVMKKALHDLDPEFSVTICGSYRRGRSESGDIDALVTHSSLKVSKNQKKQGELLLDKIVNSLKSLITETISKGDTKFMGVCRLAAGKPSRRLDIRLIPHEQYHCAVLYFTGSDVFNKEMRAHALEKRFTLNEYSLRPIGVTGVPGEPIELTSEEDIFDYIEFPYKRPEERNL